MAEHVQVLDYWFGPLDSHGLAPADRRRRWFAGQETDRHVATVFGDLVAQALAGELDHWAGQPDSLVALVTLLDQFPRNIYRGSAQAFSGDQRACQLVNQGIAQGVDGQLPLCWRTMFYMPLEHSESLAAQNLCVTLLEQMQANAVVSCQDYLRGCVDWARQHRDIIARFGRFPHRNAVLGRAPTADETAWMDGGGSRFGQ